MDNVETDNTYRMTTLTEKCEWLAEHLLDCKRDFFYCDPNGASHDRFFLNGEWLSDFDLHRWLQAGNGAHEAMKVMQEQPRPVRDRFSYLMKSCMNDLMFDCLTCELIIHNLYAALQENAGG